MFRFDEEFGGALTSPPADGTTPGTTLPAGASSPFTGSPMVAEIIDSKRVPEPNMVDNASTVSASDMESATTATNGTNLSSKTATYSRMTISVFKSGFHVTWGFSFLGRGVQEIFQIHSKGLYKHPNDSRNHPE